MLRRAVMRVVVLVTLALGAWALGIGSAQAAPPTPPGIPTGLSATPDDGSASIAFTAGSAGTYGIANYQYSTDNGTSWTARSPAATTSPVVISGLTNGSTYQVKLRAVSAVSGQTGSASAAVSVTPRTTPGAPQSLTVVPRDGEVLLSWTAPDDNGGAAITGYRVQRSTDAGSAWTTVETSVNSLDYTDTTATNDVQYWYRVNAINEAGTGMASSSASATPEPAVLTQWDTTNPGSSGANSIALPLVLGGTYDFEVDWGDGTVARVTSYLDEDAQHTYATGGVKSVSLSGTVTGWAFTQTTTNDAERLLDIAQWGSLRFGSGEVTEANLTNTGGYFQGATSFNPTATDAPDLTGTTSLRSMFWGNTAFNAAIGHWDVSGVTDMGAMFVNATSFDRDLGQWDVSNVLSMDGMFTGASAFNNGTNAHPINGWDVSSVNHMGEMFMFTGSQGFNRDISGWDTAQVQYMNGMFQGSAFNQDIGGWDIGSLLNAQDMLSGAPLSAANYDLLLLGWAPQSVVNAVTFDASAHYTSAAAAARAMMVSNGWTINDGGPVTAPSVPQEVSLSSPTPGVLAVDWEPPADDGGLPVARYSVALYRNNAFLRTYTVTDETALSMRISGGGSLAARVRATNIAGSSSWTAISAPVTIASVPGAPSAVVATSPSGGTVLTEWDAPSSDGGSDITGYTVTVYSGSAVVRTCRTTTELACTVRSLPAGTYSAAVRARNAVGNGPSSERSADVAVESPPSAPQDVSAESPSAGRLTVGWSAPAADGGQPVTAYRVYLSRNGTYLKSCTTAALTCSFAGLNAGSYSVSVRAINTHGAGPAATAGPTAVS